MRSRQPRAGADHGHAHQAPDERTADYACTDAHHEPADRNTDINGVRVAQPVMLTDGITDDARQQQHNPGQEQRRQQRRLNAMGEEREEKPIGDVLDALGVTAAIEPDTLVSGAIVLLKAVLPDGNVRLSLCHSDGLSWVERAGMVHLADAMETRRAISGIEPGA